MLYQNDLKDHHHQLIYELFEHKKYERKIEKGDRLKNIINGRMVPNMTTHG